MDICKLSTALCVKLWGSHASRPRSGDNITPAEFIAALKHPNTYNLTSPLATFLTWGSYLLLRRFFGGTLSLHDIARHNRIEHDASVVHKNTEPGDEYAPAAVDLVLLDQLLRDGNLTLQDFAKRRVMLEKVSPLGAVHGEIARGEWALAFQVFGNEKSDEISSETLRLWLHENRLIKGWKPHREIGMMETMAKSSEIRKLMSEISNSC